MHMSTDIFIFQLKQEKTLEPNRFLNFVFIFILDLKYNWQNLPKYFEKNHIFGGSW